MKFGFNLLLWCTHVTEKEFPLLEKLKAAGYDGVEVPVFEGEEAHFKKIGKVLKDNGLDCTTVTVIPDEEHSPISNNPAHRAAALDQLKWALDCSAALGAETICGPYHSPLGVFTGVGPTEEEKANGVEVHRAAAEYAQERNVVMAMEYLNRFECYFLTTMADAVDYVKRVGHPNFGTMYDTFHANIEEHDLVDVIIPNIDAIRHIHISENDRGTPGKGHIPFNRVFNAISESGYDSWLTIEAFGRALPDLAAATRVWRDLFTSQEDVYIEGFRLLNSAFSRPIGSTS